MPSLQAPRPEIDPDVFLHTIEMGDAQTLENWLKAGVSANTCNDFGWTGLHTAALCGDLVCTQLLLDFGAQPNAACQDGWTPVCEATQCQQLPVLKLLFAHGARPDLPQPWIAFQTAIRSKARTEIFSALLSELDLATVGPRGDSLIDLAIKARHINAVEALLAAGAEPPVDAQGECASLYLALSKSTEAIFLMLLSHLHKKLSVSCLSNVLTQASSGSASSTSVLNALLSAGADPLYQKTLGICAIESVCREGNERLLVYFTQAGNLHLPSSVYSWVSDGALQVIEQTETEFFFQKSQQTTRQAGRHKSPRPLHPWDPDTRQALQPYLTCFAYLSTQLPLQASADILMVAILGGDLALCQTVLAQGLDPNARDSFGRLPLVEAVGRQWGQAFQAVLLQAGADPNAQNNQGDTPLLVAIRVDEGMSRDETGTVSQFLRIGANPELARPHDGMTPLLQAISHNNSRLCAMLLDAGASPHVADWKGNTPLIYAVTKENLKICTMLLELGVNPYVVNHEGLMACHFWRRYLNDKFLSLFAHYHLALSGRDFSENQ